MALAEAAMVVVPRAVAARVVVETVQVKQVAIEEDMAAAEQAVQ